VGTLLHTADLCNPCLSIEPAKEWEKRISHEFLFQSTLEVEHGLPVAPFMLKYDMLSRVVNQNHFMTAVAYPQWKTFVEVFPVMSARLDQLVRALVSQLLPPSHQLSSGLMRASRRQTSVTHCLQCGRASGL
jgi:hypothetical protein